MENAAELPEFRPTILRPLLRWTWALAAFIVMFGLWAVFAELATTVRIDGNLSAAQPSREIQHRTGGRIADVSVQLHQVVDAGDQLFRFDVALQEGQLEEISRRMSLLLAENAIIADELSATVSSRRSMASNVAADLVANRYAEARHVLALQIEGRESAITAARRKLTALLDEVALLNERRDLHAGHLADTENLLRKGIARQQDRDRIAEVVLALDGEIQSNVTRRLELEEQILANQMAIRSMRAERRAGLADQLNANVLRISELRAQALQLNGELNEASVLAPVSGMITTLAFGATEMVARAGETLAVIAEPLGAPSIELRIPVAQIDQIDVGMTGKLTINSLSQRDMPDISVTIAAVSSEAVKDRDGLPLYYQSTAETSDGDLETAAEALGDAFRLSKDMPVTAMIEGRKTTFFEFMARPFIKILQDALQDS